MLTDTEIEVLSKRLSRLEGQVRAVKRMVQEKRYCIDIMNQLTAIANAATKASMLVMASHMRTCVKTAFKKGDPDLVDKVSDELVETVFKSVKN